MWSEVYIVCREGEAEGPQKKGEFLGKKFVVFVRLFLDLFVRVGVGGKVIIGLEHFMEVKSYFGLIDGSSN